MDIVEKIKSELKKESRLKKSQIDINFDNQDNIIVYVTDKLFETISDEEAQTLLWGQLKQRLSSEEFIRIIVVFHETPKEKIQRVSGIRSNEIRHSKFWCHETPELAKYWVFIDVAKIGEEFRSFFLIICEKNKIEKGLTFVYSKEILDFMELKQKEVYEELYLNTYNTAEAEIKMDLMNRYEELTAQQLYGKANVYWYVFQDFSLKPVTKNQVMLNSKEITMLNEATKNKKLDNFAIMEDIQFAIKKSEGFNNLKQQITGKL